MRKTINLRTKEKIEMLDNLRTLLVAGIPIITALDELIEESKGPVHKVLLSVRHDVSEGKSLFSSLDALENTMDKVTLNLIKSAEQSGSLEETLKDIIIFLKRSEEFSSKIKAALLYPTMVVALFLGILLIILYYVIPRISSVFYKLKVDIPITTRVLIIVSNFFVENTVAILSGLLFISVMVSVLYHFKKRSLQTLTFSLPLMRNLAKKLDLARFTGDFEVLLRSGMPINQALDYSGDVVLQKKTANAIKKSAEAVGEGASLADGLRKSKNVFPTSMIRITEVGEKSGSLEQSMSTLAEKFNKDIDENLKTITVVLEPVLLIIIGIFVGSIMLSIIAPIYKLIGEITPR